MKRNFIFYTFILMIFSGCSGNPKPKESYQQPLVNPQQSNFEKIDNSYYRLASGDRIFIKVFDQEDLSLEILLADSGIINYPYLNEIQIGGLTVRQIESLITKGLEGDYLRNPSVQVSVVEYRPFFIDGEVNNSGGFPYQTGLTVRKAVSLAGGFSERASQSSIYVIRANDNSQKKIKVSMDSPIFPGDVLTIEESFF